MLSTGKRLLTAVPAAPPAPSFDSVGAGDFGGSKNFSWSQTIGTGANGALLALMHSTTVGYTVAAKIGASTNLVTVNSANYWNSGVGHFGYFSFLKFEGLLPSGSQTITVTFSGGFPYIARATLLTYFDVGSFGTMAAVNGSGTSISESAPSGSSNGLIVNAMGNNGATDGSLSAYSRTQRFNQPTVVASTALALVVGDTADDGSAKSFTATTPSAGWVSSSIPILAAA